MDGDLIAQFLVDNPAVRIVDLSSGCLEDGLEWATAVAGELVVTKDICEGSRLMHRPCIRVPLRESGVHGGLIFQSNQSLLFVNWTAGISYYSRLRVVMVLVTATVV